MTEKKRIFLKREHDPVPEQSPKGFRFVPKRHAGGAQPAQQNPKPAGWSRQPARREDSSVKALVFTIIAIALLLILLVAYAATRPRPLPLAPAPAPVVPHSAAKPNERLWMREYMQQNGDPEALKERKARIAGQ